MIEYAILESLRTHHVSTYYHSLRVGNLAYLLGKRHGLIESRCILLMRAGLLHDVGKLFIPKEILNFPGRLDKNQYELVQLHVELGVNLLKEYKIEYEIIQTVMGHHEREDGNGYPSGGVSHNEFSKIIAVCDVFDAMTEVREYKKSLEKDVVLKMLKNGELGALSPKYIELLTDVVVIGINQFRMKVGDNGIIQNYGCCQLSAENQG